MSRIINTIAAATVFAGLFGASAFADTTKPFAGVVIVPASYSASDEAVSPSQAPRANAQFRRAAIVAYQTKMAPGSIIVNTRENALYFVIGNGQAAKYRIASAKPGFEWQGTNKVSAKTQWPSWRPPVEMRQRRPELPEFMAGGPKNPLGARAIYLGSTIYRIHGTNEPKSIGKAASSGCIRMLNEDVTELYQFVKIGATVTVL
ncbi:L,D-transpeptidase [Aestuariivirga sp.]|uniref:L,D-transpeptidase n=1 Tax=Aestuariivirga sp. TaxID=2650926 RepID=UPI0039E66DD6